MSPNTMRMHSVNIQRSKKVGNVFISEPKITRIDHSEKKKDATDAASDSVFSRRTISTRKTNEATHRTIAVNWVKESLERRNWI